MAYISSVLTQMVAAVKKSAVAITRDFNELEHLQTSIHSDGMFATRSYNRALKTLSEELIKAKNYPLISSVKDTIPASGNYFMVAPIDGFANFAHGNGDFAISVAMFENNVAVDAVVYSPIFDELFFTEKGCGAFKEGFRNYERMRVAGSKIAEKALISCNADIEILQKVCALSPNVRVKGSVALDLAYVAAGKTDAVVATDVASSSLAAGMLLIKESGGYIFAIGETDIRSEDLNKVLFGGNIIATNEALKQKIADIMAK